jgi:hypothetical protein
MLKRLDPLLWSNGDLTGGGSFVATPEGLLVVSPVRHGETGSNTFAILKSVDEGNNWTEVSRYTFPHPTPLSEPQVAYDAIHDSLYILMTADDTAGLASLLLFCFHVEAELLNAPVVLVTAQRFKPSYTVCYDAPSDEVLVLAMAIGAQGPTVAANKTVVLEVATSRDLSILRTRVMQDVTSSATTLGSLQLLSTPSGVELYCVQRSRTYKLAPSDSQLLRFTKGLNDALWDIGTVLWNYTAEFNDDKLTVIQSGLERYLAMVWWDRQVFVQDKKLAAKLVYNLRLGHTTNGLDWSWFEFPSQEALTEPTLAIGSDGKATVAYLQKDANHVTSGLLRIVSWDPLGNSMLDVDLGLRDTPFAYLRSSLRPTTSQWAYLGVKMTGESFFISSKNLPPTVVLNTIPSGDVLHREIPILLDASATTDPDNDPMRFSWTVEPSANVVLLADNNKATLRVKNAWGPAPGVVIVTLQVEDLDPDGLPRHAPVEVTHSFQVLQDFPPTVNWYENPIYVGRIRNLVLSPVFSDPDGDAISILWEQTLGTPCTFNNGNNNTTLDLTLAVTKVLGETLRFRVTVTDGINAPVVSSVEVIIPPIKRALRILDGNFLNRTYWSYDGGA